MPVDAQRIAAAVGLCLGCVPILAPAGEQTAEPERPDMELIEFLGTWETGDGKWVDPMALKDIDEEALREFGNSGESAADEHDGDGNSGDGDEKSDRDPEENDHED